MHPYARPSALMFADANFLAHVSRLVEVSKTLRSDHDFEIRFAGEGPYLHLAREQGFEILPCFTVPKQATLDLARKATLVDPLWWYRVVDRSIRSDAEVIRRARPDVVVGDMHWSLGAAAVACGVPYVSIVNASWTNHFAHEIEALDGHVLTRLLGPSRAKRWFPRFRELALRYWALPYKIWRARTGHRRLDASNLFSVVEGDLTLFPDIPEFCPTRELPENAFYVGPILWKPEAPPPAFLASLARDRKTIYVSMGSTGKQLFFETALRAFADGEHQVVMTTGEVALSGEKVPANFHITDFAPGQAIMARSDLCINQGGNGTIYQALEAGVPVVGLPTHVDQQIQMQLCERAGVGRAIAERDFSEKSLRETVAAVLADGRCRERAEALRAVLSGYEGPRDAARRIASLVNEPDPQGVGVRS